MPEASAAPRRVGGPWLDALIVLLLAVYVASGRDAVPFHGDESTFVWMSRDVHTLLQTRDPQRIAYDPATREPLAQQLRLLNGSLTPLAIGLITRAAGFTRRDLNGPWIWVLPQRTASEQWRFNVSAGRLPRPELLSWARLPSALAAAASVALVFAIAMATTRSRPAAWMAAILYATHPALLLNGRRAMQEGILLLATALLVWVAMRTLRAHPRGEPRAVSAPWLLALAGATGVALAAKHAALAVAAAAWLVVVAAPWLGGEPLEPRAKLRHLATCLGAAIAGVALFAGLSPVWWSLPRWLALAGLAGFALSFCIEGPRRAGPALRVACVAAIAVAFALQPSWLATSATQARQAVAARHALLREQASRPGLDTAPMRPTELAREAFFAEPQFFEDSSWSGFPEIQRQIEAYLRSPLAGRVGPWRWPVGVLLAGLVTLGLFALARRREPEDALLAAWIALPALVLLASPLPWQRYILTLHAPLAVLAGHGAASLRAPRGEAR